MRTIFSSFWICCERFISFYHLCVCYTSKNENLDRTNRISYIRYATLPLYFVFFSISDTSCEMMHINIPYSKRSKLSIITQYLLGRKSISDYHTKEELLKRSFEHYLRIEIWSIIFVWFVLCLSFSFKFLLKVEYVTFHR